MKKILMIIVAMVCFSAVAEEVTFTGKVDGRFGGGYLRIVGEANKTTLKEVSPGVVKGADFNALGIASGDQVEVTIEADGFKEHNGKKGWSFKRIIRIKKL